MQPLYNFLYSDELHVLNTFHFISVPKAPPTSIIKVLQLLLNGSASVLDISWIHVVSLNTVLSDWSLLVKIDLPYREAMYHNIPVQGSCIGLSCTYSQYVKTTGSYYTVTISSANDGGEGPESGPVQVTYLCYHYTSTTGFRAQLSAGSEDRRASMENTLLTENEREQCNACAVPYSQMIDQRIYR